ncbi:class III poly(R)-hydroxyalkanoic acid synthase subunit PhaC [Hymenobacter sp. HSC-4F20]|uniref:class III poly(R)-hydroxyalkanoic acid synthase subunit PhaC n=1 Tax=Hymenobacter sp. HSC-4F20 TaxID=2864135 RepID=UPI001C7344AA|nr:class III poly(R)-hydroxyalkanoic acid synthase subunit PhaC [Hymenobacter sp. HSC-4F20]MBX0290272.1 class III poly(R)-hydroxyalkanoic acid synthase subunit PhaC [Hymenobacter sp. HSC-4F20]
MDFLSPQRVLEEFAATTTKLAKGFDALKQLDEVAVGVAPKQAVWKKDKVQLLQYVRETPATARTPILIVYALVNRHDMMDIQADRSFIRNLQAAGLDLYLIDWGYPTPEDRYFTMDEYINGYLDDAVNVIRARTGQPAITLMGICQGGTFSVIYSALHPQKVKNLVTLVTPIDFATPRDLLSKWAQHLDVDALVDAHGNVPGELLNAGFALLKPLLKTTKYVSILNAVDKPEQLLNFLRMEQWIADSPSQAGECFRQFVKELYQQNRLIKGTLELGGRTVRLADITMPLLNIYAQEDHLVPPEASIPLNDLVGSLDKSLTRFAGGHIGVFVGSRSQKELAPGIAHWLHERDT